MFDWILDHATLVLVVWAACVATVVMAFVDNAFVTTFTAGLWNLVVLLVVFDVTPRSTQEKRERV